MPVLRQKTKARKAELEANAAAAEAKRAAAESAAAVRDLAQALMAQVKQLGIDEKTSEAMERVKASPAYGRAQAKADELSKRVAESETFTAGRENLARRSAQALAGLGAWLATGERGKRLGIAPSKRRGRGWLFGLVGVGLGYAIGMLTAPKEGGEFREQLLSRARDRSGPAVTGSDGHAATGGDGAPPFERPLADRVRTRLGEDPRTAGLPKLNVSVVGNTVVLRGAVPEGTDPAVIRDVVAGVEGVDDVDMELGSAL